MRKSSRRLLCITALGALLPAAAVAQNVGAVAGTVTDRATNQPIATAQVVIVGTTLGTITNAQGEFTVSSVPPGARQVRVMRLGYQAVTQPVTVTAGVTATVNFTLQASAVALDVVTVTATGEQQRARERGNSVPIINVDSLNLAPIPTLSDLLSSRAPGIVVQTAGGTTGTTSRIRIRGSNSVSLSNDPLILIDGVRAENSPGSSSIGVGGQEPSRFNDINPEDIEKIEVLKGPAASALYGTAAANGVIQITTKKGIPGKARWNVFAEGGEIREITSFPANFVRFGVTTNRATAAQNGVATVCTLENEERALCAPDANGLRSFNPLEDPTATPFRDGWRSTFGVNVAGGTENTTYYLATDFEREQGIYDANGLKRVNLRTNVRSQVRDNVDITASVGYLDSELTLPQNDNNLFGFISGGLLGEAEDDPDGRGYAAGFPPSLFTQAANTQQDINRLTGSFNLNWQITPWLRGVGIAGLDMTTRNDHETINPNIIFSFGLEEGERTNNRHVFATYTGNGGLTAEFTVRPELQSTTSIGAQYTEERTRSTEAFGAILLPGTSSLEGASARFAVDEDNVENITVGLYAQQQLAWKDRLFVTGAIRADDNSAFGQDFGLVYYPSASISYVISEEQFFPVTRWLSSLRLRGAYGESGQRPSFRDAVTFFSPVAVTVGGSSIAAIAIGGTGNPELEPERSREFEAGFEAGFLEGRLGMDFTWYTRSTQNALIARRLAPSLGQSTTRFENIGEVENRGWELQLNSRVLQLRDVAWDLTVSASSNENKLIELGEGIDPIIFGLGGASQRHQEGYPLGSYFEQPVISAEDKNGDGVITRAGCPGTLVVGAGGVPLATQPECEVILGDTAVFQGRPFPKLELTFSSSITLFRLVQVSALLDRRSGYQQFNSTESFRCASTFQNCRAAFDPSAPLTEQAKAAAAARGSEDFYMEDADFWKLREVSVSVSAPTAWARRLGAEQMRLTLAGRNLKTWTDYSGFDPEVNQFGFDNFATADFLTQPNVRTFTARLQLSW
ncbi:MAG TPA: SusC/RagA family TonB-linked outer membrane protein [Gemmatimonadaceae bacterium]|nr:SusC/RagA family TonB-linked outer membrane protein [Gemmatimonadaceae bacterium]